MDSFFVNCPDVIQATKALETHIRNCRDCHVTPDEDTHYCSEAELLWMVYREILRQKTSKMAAGQMN
jgi:hypothetical protein